MTYASKDTSLQDSAPILLYQFVNTTTYRYAAFPTDVTALGYTWTHENIDPGGFGQSSEMPKDSLSIKLPITNALAATFLGGSPEGVTTLTVFRTHYDDAGYIMYWKGRVLSSSASIGTVTLSCEPVFASMRRTGVRAVYSRPCRHAFGGAGCHVDLSPLAASGTVSAVNRTAVTVSLSPEPTVSMIGGVMKAPDGSMRTIIDQSDSSHYTVSRKFPSLAVGNTAIVYPPCNHTIGDCVANANLGNFGGQPYIPGINPFTNTSSIFYK